MHDPDFAIVLFRDTKNIYLKLMQKQDKTNLIEEQCKKVLLMLPILLNASL